MSNRSPNQANLDPNSKVHLSDADYAAEKAILESLLEKRRSDKSINAQLTALQQVDQHSVTDQTPEPVRPVHKISNGTAALYALTMFDLLQNDAEAQACPHLVPAIQQTMIAKDADWALIERSIPDVLTAFVKASLQASLAAIADQHTSPALRLELEKNLSNSGITHEMNVMEETPHVKDRDAVTILKNLWRGNHEAIGAARKWDERCDAIVATLLSPQV